MKIPYTPIKTVITQTTCDFHKEHPGVPYAGCCCSFNCASVELTAEEQLQERLKKFKDQMEGDKNCLPNGFCFNDKTNFII